ncbi:class I glutamine amidotransferase-like protein [Pseudovirgaria hyperparasitica]|uniref:Class I glutamine amidotransferase-like protein n=1 Tax=Pseudovirgaria hyperparasitica TaxID=470096 RepID=A0A6A6WHY8_9PEZI|nr:class I glutamine amidotransferase-like protein [Pseudovirgaria hyperparasitica]KAF2761694.1 class I glutamine amidotransferase-like protein [Pseudovirgaria hyperparasitica]
MSEHTTFSLSKPGRKIHAGVVLMNSVTELLDIGVVDLLGSIDKKNVEKFPEEIYSDEHKAQALEVEIHWVNETGGAGKLSPNLTLQATDSFETCPPLDIVVMGACEFAYTPTEAELNFIRKAYSDCSAFIAVCGGMMTPMQAGLLKGKTATCPLPILSQLEATAPETTWVRKRFHRDGKLWTTGTLLNGLDAMAEFADETWGGKGTLMDHAMKMCAWPRRDVYYKDVEA